jgi:hypothetical protein
MTPYRTATVQRRYGRGPTGITGASTRRAAAHARAEIWQIFYPVRTCLREKDFSDQPAQPAVNLVAGRALDWDRDVLHPRAWRKVL